LLGSLAITMASLTPGGALGLPETPALPDASPAPAAAMPDGTVADASPQNLKLVRDPTARLRLAVTINGQGPYDFLVDTGSDRTVISRELAALLNLPAGPKVIIHENAGVDEAPTAVIDRLAIGDRVVRHIEAPAVAAKDLGALGMVGVDALRNLHLVMDFKVMRLSSSPSHAEPLEPGTIVVHGRGRFGQLILADAKVKGVQVFVVVDTGSEISVGNPALLRLLNGDGPSRAPAGKTTLVGVTGRTTDADLDLVPEANVGGLEIHNMQLAFAQDHIFDRLKLVREPALLLGMDVLSQCQRISVDIRKREATFTLN
jgi:predicted aspartyl protease